MKRTMSPARDSSPLRRLRQERGLTQDGLSIASGVSTAMITKAEVYGILSESIARRLACALGVEPNVLFGGPEAAPRGKK